MKEDRLAMAVTASGHFLKKHRTGAILLTALVIVAVVASIVVVNARAESRRQRQAQLAEAMLGFQAMNYPQAALLFESFIERYPSGPFSDQARFHCATAQFMAGNYPRALALYQECAAMGSRDPEWRHSVQEGIASCREAQGELSQAADLYERLAQDPPQEGLRAVLLAKAGHCYQKASDWTSVRRVADTLLEEFGEETTWYNEASRLKARAAVLETLEAEGATADAGDGVASE